MIARNAKSEQALQLFADLCDLPAAEQRKRLEASTRDQPGLRAEVDELLRADRRSLTRLDHPATLIADLTPQRWNPAEDPKFIGSHRVLRRIGLGGMSVVYEAEQPGTLRRVAVKVLASRLGDSRAIDRFLFETRALASLSHPRIAQIFEAGTANLDGGERPFFVMQLVDGSPLTKHAEERRLSIPDRVCLLILLAEAIHHAHQKGIIHRDLKPGNILVDGEGPKILDFGVACPVIESTTDPGSRALSRERAGTLQYMSPEQVSADESSVDIRSDLYSLGVVGYQLLSGRPPYPVEDDDVTRSIRNIQEVIPAPLGLAGEHSRDLEAIVRKALQKSPGQRYDSASALAEDLKRCLSFHPIRARKTGRMELLSRFRRRNPQLAAAIILLTLAIGLGLSGTTWQRNQALAHARSAETSAQNAQQANSLASFRSAQLFAQRGLWSEALAAYEEAAANDYPDPVELILGKVEALDGNLEYERVRVELARLAELPDLGRHRARSLFLRALFHVRTGISGEPAGWSKVLPLMQEALDAASNPGSGFSPSDAGMARAFLADDLATTRDLLRENLAHHPNHRRSRVALIPLLIILGEVDDGRQHARTLQALSPRDPTGVFFEGVACAFIPGGESALEGCATRLTDRGFDPMAQLLLTMGTFSNKLRGFDQNWSEFIVGGNSISGSILADLGDMLSLLQSVSALLKPARSSSLQDQVIDLEFSVSPALVKLFQTATRTLVLMPLKSLLPGNPKTPVAEVAAAVNQLIEVHPIGAWFLMRGCLKLVERQFAEAEVDFQQALCNPSPAPVSRAPRFGMLAAQMGQAEAAPKTRMEWKEHARRRAHRSIEEISAFNGLSEDELRFLCHQSGRLGEVEQSYALALRWYKSHPSALSLATMADLESRMEAWNLATRHAQEALEFDIDCDLAHTVLDRVDAHESK